MKARRSLRWFMLKFLISLVVLMVIAYFIWFKFFFIEGLKQSVVDVLEMEAISFQEQYQKDPSTPMPQTGLLQSFTGYDRLPENIRQWWPEEIIREGKFLYKEEYVDEDFFKPPEEFRVTFLLPYQLNDGKMIYLLMSFGEENLTQASQIRFDHNITLMWIISAVVLLIMIVAVWFLTRRLIKPMESMAHWADDLSLEKIDKPIPGLRYNELETVATKLQQAFRRIGEVLEHEHRFLRNASHELRTPIAVIRGNAELLNKILSSDAKARPCVARIERNATNMQHLTETLLWLSREEEPIDGIETVVLDTMLQSVLDEHRYLIEGKQVEIVFSVAPFSLQTKATPLRIVLANLIRNAFQHTAQGTVTISLEEETVIISNQNEGADDGAGYDGYGLGLALVEMITSRMGWQCQHEEIAGGRKVQVFGFRAKQTHQV